MPSNAVCPMPLAFRIGFIFNAVGIADAVTSIVMKPLLPEGLFLQVWSYTTKKNFQFFYL